MESQPSLDVTLMLLEVNFHIMELLLLLLERVLVGLFPILTILQAKPQQEVDESCAIQMT